MFDWLYTGGNLPTTNPGMAGALVNEQNFFYSGRHPAGRLVQNAATAVQSARTDYARAAGDLNHGPALFTMLFMVGFGLILLVLAVRL